MKFAFFFSALMIQVNVFARCASNGIWCWPSADVVNPNSILILEFYGSSREVAEGLDDRYPVYLKAGNQKLRLNVIEKPDGGFMLTQRVMKPEAALTCGVRYELVIENLEAAHRNYLKWDSQDQKFTSYSWMVSEKKDTTPPAWTGQPTFLSKSYSMFGCGPAKYVHFAVSTADTSPVFAKTSLKNLATGKISTFYLQIEEGRIAIGHGMCSGAFKLDDGTSYEVSFVLVDASGNISIVAQQVQFRAPVPSDEGSS